MKFFITFFLVLISVSLFSQVKVGDNPSIIDLNSILELESNDKVFVLTRLTDAQINALSPLPGALVYNTDTQCIYAFDGAIWKSLCNAAVSTSISAPTLNNIGDVWFNSSNGIVSVWNGSAWLPININPRRGIGPPSGSLTNLLAGDIYVDESTGDLYTYDGTSWVIPNQNVNNGLSISGNTIQLGGLLISPTVITTNSTNTLALLGLDNTTLDGTNSLVVADNTTGVLKKISTSAFVEQQQIVVTAINGQIQFTPPSIITDADKIDVYRNGVRIAFTIINTNTIEIEPEAICYAGDEIRIVQLN